MYKITLLLVISIFAFNLAKAQTADEVYNLYLDFNLSRLQGETDKALSLGERILPDTAKLGTKARTSFYYAIAHLYENDNQSTKAFNYYQKVTTAIPDYYVARRALGYLYLKKAEAIATQLNAEKTNAAENKRLTSLYYAAVKKVLPHLEKAQACDPDNGTLSLIKMLYKNIKDDKELITLNSRLAVMGKTCIDVLSDK